MAANEFCFLFTLIFLTSLILKQKFFSILNATEACEQN